MRIALMADIHGNAPALRAVLAQMPPVDRILVAGDVLGYYPFFEQCLDLLGEAGAVVLLGNHEAMLRGDIPTPKQAVFDWYRDIFEDQASSRTRSWLLAAGTNLGLDTPAGRMFVCHGSPWRVDEYIYQDYAHWSRFQELPAEIIVMGHTHRPLEVRQSGKWIINPGSVGQPRNHAVGACYAVLDLDLNSLQQKRADYDPTPVLESLEKLGCPHPGLADAVRPSGQFQTAM